MRTFNVTRAFVFVTISAVFVYVIIFVMEFDIFFHGRTDLTTKIKFAVHEQYDTPKPTSTLLQTSKFTTMNVNSNTDVTKHVLSKSKSLQNSNLKNLTTMNLNSNTDVKEHVLSKPEPLQNLNLKNLTAVNLNSNTDVREHAFTLSKLLQKLSLENSTTVKVNWNMTVKKHNSSNLGTKNVTSNIKKQHAMPTKNVFNRVQTVQDVNCNAMINRDLNELSRAKTLTLFTKKVVLSSVFYINITQNCSNFILERGYIINSLTDKEENFPLAFSILMYRDIEQVERLLRSIYRPQNVYCIHVDSKSPSTMYKGMLAIAGCFENVFVLETRYDVVWGKLSVITPELHCMDELLKKTKTWKYFINLTGQEFPLRTNLQLVKILEVFKGENYIVGAKPNRDYSYRWISAGPVPHGIIPQKGTVHIVASRGYVEFLCHDERALDFLIWANKTKVPDETYFSSLNFNPFLGVPGSQKEFHKSNLTTEYIRMISRYKIWSQYDCQGKIVRGICVFGLGDLPVLASRKEMFVNKLFQSFEPYTLDCLEELHYNRTRDEYIKSLPFDAEWYSMFVRRS